MIGSKNPAFIVLLSVLIFPACTLAQKIAPASPITPVPAVNNSNHIETAAQISQIFTGIGTVYLLFQSFTLTRRLKNADILLELCRRYDHLVDSRERINTLFPNATSPTPHDIYYYEKLWNLHNDEFHFWRQGYIDERIYKIWLDARHAEFHNTNNKTGGTTYQNGWEAIKKINKDQDFQEAMQMVFNGKASDVINKYQKKKI